MLTTTGDDAVTVAAESDAATDTEADEAAVLVSAETEVDVEAEGEGAEAEGEEAVGEEAEAEAVAVPRAAFDAVVPLSLPPPPPPPQAAIKTLIATAMKVRDNTTGRSDFVMAKRNTEWANESRIHEAGASHQACPHADDR